MSDKYLDDMVLESEDVLNKPEDVDLDEHGDIDLNECGDIDLDEYGDVESENVDLDEPEYFDLDRLESNDTDSNNNNEDSIQSSVLLQTSVVKRQKKIEKLSGSPVKVFYKTRLIDNLEF
ncbi:6073_t:CDS:1 [Scutellospora calospora]|uniref:6073_t:CDS:1 n=1 Tax=Scutellospora calospora TaxID=85575 RepID=A0ACA9KC31_9GLOM|nr:6073_t:CDS:1 [Scutellospora calospora]